MREYSQIGRARALNPPSARALLHAPYNSTAITKSFCTSRPSRKTADPTTQNPASAGTIRIALGSSTHPAIPRHSRLRASSMHVRMSAAGPSPSREAAGPRRSAAHFRRPPSPEPPPRHHPPATRPQHRRTAPPADPSSQFQPATAAASPTARPPPRPPRVNSFASAAPAARITTPACSLMIVA